MRTQVAPAPGHASRPTYRAAYRRPVHQLQALLVLAVILGGGGVAYGLHNAAIQISAIAVLAFNPGAVRGFINQAPRPLVALVVLTVALPLLQAVPLPPAVWQALPGRALVVESLTLAGAADGTWFPLSIDRMRTLVAAAGLIVPATLIVVGTGLHPGERLLLAHTAIALALGSVLLGTIQLASANTAMTFYPLGAAPDVLYATFSNRNSAGLMMVIALILLAASPRPAAPRWLAIGAGAALLLVLGTVLTQSRSSMALLLLPVALFAFRLIRARFTTQGKRADRPANTRVAIAMLGAFAALATIAFALTDLGRVTSSLGRFSVLETDRLEMWDDARYVAQVYFPAGTGMGTFDEVFQAHESLEYVSPRTAGRAHQDYLELAIEGGLAALLLALAWLAWAAWGAITATVRDEVLRLGAGVAAAAIAAQSLLDYPLRNQALLTVAAVLVLLLANTHQRNSRKERL